MKSLYWLQSVQNMQPLSHAGYNIDIHNASILSPGMGRPWCLWWPLLVSHRTYAKRHGIVMHVLCMVSVVSVVWHHGQHLPGNNFDIKMRFEAQARFMHNLPPIKLCPNVVIQIICFNVVLSMRLQPHITHTYTKDTMYTSKLIVPCMYVTTQQTPKRLCTAHARAQILT